MAEATLLQPLSQRLEVLAALEPSPLPVLGLYVRLAPNQNGREDSHQFLRKVFSERAKRCRNSHPIARASTGTAGAFRNTSTTDGITGPAAWAHC